MPQSKSRKGAKRSPQRAQNVRRKPLPEGTTDKFMRPLPMLKVECTLCYRNCTLSRGEVGPCGHRANELGRMKMRGHGEITCFIRDILGFGGNPFATYKPNKPGVFVGGSRCTAACTFCSSGRAVHKPEALPKVEPAGARPQEIERLTDAGLGDLWYGPRGWMEPEYAVVSAIAQGAQAITLGINEPLLTWEWTRDVARHAKARGLDVCVESNGFASREAIEQLAPFVDAVDVGIKGSADPGFYERRMRSPGGQEAALEAIGTWARTGVHLIVGDLLAPPKMQEEAAFVEGAKRLYATVLESAGEVVDLLSTIILKPMPSGGAVPGLPIVGEPEWPGVVDRIEHAEELARAAGLPFVRHYPRTLPCPCGMDLLTNIDICDDALPKGMPCRIQKGFCDRQRTTPNVTQDRRCASCGRAVPVVPMTPQEAELAAHAIRSGVQETFGDALPVGDPLNKPLWRM
jgi:pyruvate-formate lyase-activating enzyme